MLTVYRRHRGKCKFQDDRISKKCRCALWAKGTLEGNPYQKSLKTRSFERAQQIIRDIENGSRPEQPKSITIKDALAAFVKDCEARNLNASTLRKYKLLRDKFADFLTGRGLGSLVQLDNQTIRQFREKRILGARTASKELERLRAFFRFCVENGWLQTNPAKSIKAPEVRPKPTLPFSEQEVVKLLGNVDARAATFYRVLLHSGLRIIDAAALRPERIQGGKLFLYQQKTGQPVWVPLPPDLVEDLRHIPLVGGFYFAVESGNPVSIAEYYRVKLKKAAKAAGVANAHPHRFRDTFAVRLLEKGVSLEHVSILLGHTDIKTTQRAYYPWVKSLQDNLESAVQKTWAAPKLVRVK